MLWKVLKLPKLQGLRKNLGGGVDGGGGWQIILKLTRSGFGTNASTFEQVEGLTAAVDFYAKIANEPDQHPKLLKFCNEVLFFFLITCEPRVE